jgi:hypothetical protein
MATISRTAKNGAREVFNLAAYLDDQARAGRDAARYVSTCGRCGRIWDDGIVSGVTPTPAARCPFEYSHRRG